MTQLVKVNQKSFLYLLLFCINGERTMSFYTWLKPRTYDTSKTLKLKLRTTKKLKKLRLALQTHIKDAKLSDDINPPSDSTEFVRIATWNIREFDSSSYGERTMESKAYIAEILSHFDLIALQEIRRDLDALRDVVRILGSNWDFIATDVTEGSSGNKERMAFLFNKNKVWFNDVAGELTLPNGKLVTDPFGVRFKVEGGAKMELPNGQTLKTETNIIYETTKDEGKKIKEDVEIELPEDTKIVLPAGTSIRFPNKSILPMTDEHGIDLEQSNTLKLPESAEIILPENSFLGMPKQFARTPFIASFQAGWLKINLATVHIYYGKGKSGMERRKEEIKRLTKLLSDRAKSDSDSDADSYFIALGDFNIVTPEHETMEALKTNHFEIPKPLQNVPGGNVKQDRHYDQIALWKGQSKRKKSYTDIIPYRAGVFDFFDTVFKDEEEDIYAPFMKKHDSDEYYASYRSWRTHQMSDHLPMWLELRIDFTEAYLDEVENTLQDQINQ